LLLLLLYLFSADSSSISQVPSNNGAQKWLVIALYTVGVSAQSTLRGTKHF